VSMGDAQSVVQRYLNDSIKLAGEKHFDLAARPAARVREVAFTGVRILNCHRQVTATINLTEGMYIEIAYQVRKAVHGAQISFRLWNSQAICVLTSTDFDNELSRVDNVYEPGSYTAACYLSSEFLRPGSYWVDLISVIPNTKNLDDQPQCIGFEVLDDGSVDSALAQKRMGVVAPRFKWEIDRVS
jgi:hypothetical protein